MNDVGTDQCGCDRTGDYSACPHDIRGPRGIEGPAGSPTLILGDCIEEMLKLDAESVHAVVCDPPYLIAFMGKDFDQQEGAHADPKKMQEWHERWAREALRVLKPGGFLLAFGGTRTYHRLACAVEDAGFEIRDRFWTPGGEVVNGELAWFTGSGFPKSLDAAKAIDKALGAEGGYGGPKTPRHAEYLKSGYGTGKHDGWDRPWMDDEEAVERTARKYVPTTEQATRFSGYGTALKPAHEPILVARKPLIGTVAANVLAHGTGAINIDGCRVGFAGAADERETKEKNRHEDFGSGPRENEVYGTDERARSDQGNYDAPGRWPANVILCHLESCVQVGTREVASDGHYPSARPRATEITTVGHAGQDDLEERHTRGETVEQWECAPGCPVAELDAQSGSAGAAAPVRGDEPSQPAPNEIYGTIGRVPGTFHGDSGGASRFFYTAKVSRAERNAGVVLCRCKTSARWVNEGREANTQAERATQPQRDTTGSTTPSKADTDSPTMSSGSENTDRSLTDSRSTTETETSRTTTSRTSNSSPTSTTSESTPRTIDALPTDLGNDDAPSAECGNPPPPTTTTSRRKGGSDTDAADLATSERSLSRSSEDAGPWCSDCGGLRGGHPTVKPITLMRWLIRLVTPPGGTVLDPFLGSGSTGCAAALEPCVGHFIGIERDPGYMKIAEARIAFWAEHGEDGLRIIAEREQAGRRRREVEDAGQLDLFAGRS